MTNLILKLISITDIFIPEEKACGKIVYNIHNTKRTRRRGFWVFTCGRINYCLGCDHRNRIEEMINFPEQLKDQKQINFLNTTFCTSQAWLVDFIGT